MTAQLAPRLPRSLQLAVGLLVALLALAFAGYIALESPTSRASATGPEAGTSLPAPSRVLVIGDSYAAGTGAPSPDRGLVGLLAQRTGWTISNRSRGGTGYVASFASGGEAACGQSQCATFGKMLERTAEDVDDSGVRSDPDMVLVIGGRNDVGRAPERVGAAINRFYLDARKDFSDARIVAVGPLSDDDRVPAQLRKIRSDVKRSVEAVDGLYLDIGQPLKGEPDLVAKDGVHPNGRGHAAIADALLTALSRRGVSVSDRG